MARLIEIRNLEATPVEIAVAPGDLLLFYATGAMIRASSSASAKTTSSSSVTRANRPSTTEGTPVPNLAIMMYGANSTVRVFNLSGFTHYLYDASAVVLSD